MIETVKMIPIIKKVFVHPNLFNNAAIMGADNAGPIPQEVIQTLIPNARCFLNHFIITGINGTRSKECPIPMMNPYVIYREVRFFE